MSKQLTNPKASNINCIPSSFSNAKVSGDKGSTLPSSFGKKKK